MDGDELGAVDVARELAATLEGFSDHDSSAAALALQRTLAFLSSLGANAAAGGGRGHTGRDI